MIASRAMITAMFVCGECGASWPEAGWCPEHGQPLAPKASHPLLGEMIGNYRVARVLGAGATGVVYLGVHPTIGSRVAIKVLSPDCAREPGLVNRFFAEARAANMIRHESIVNVLDLCDVEDRPSIVMEYVDGQSLSAVFEAGRMTVSALSTVMFDVLSALDAAHKAGIVHRDVKPENIYVTRRGRAKLLDFGLAKLKPLVPGVTGTATGALLGSPYYLSPELAQGFEIDARTDLYSVGVILYEGFTGRRPFISDNLYELLLYHVSLPPTPPSRLVPGLEPAVEAVIMTALAKRPNDRFATAAEMANALRGALNIPARPAAPPRAASITRPPGVPQRRVEISQAELAALRGDKKD